MVVRQAFESVEDILNVVDSGLRIPEVSKLCSQSGPCRLVPVERVFGEDRVRAENRLRFFIFCGDFEEGASPRDRLLILFDAQSFDTRSVYCSGDS